MNAIDLFISPGIDKVSVGMIQPTRRHIPDDLPEPDIEISASHRTHFERRRKLIEASNGKRKLTHAEKISLSMKERWQDPRYRAIRSQVMKDWHARNRKRKGRPG